MAHKPTNDKMKVRMVVDVTMQLDKAILLEDTEQHTFCDAHGFFSIYNYYFDNFLTDDKQELDERREEE